VGVVYLTEEEGQAEAADVLMLALLVSFSSFLIAAYGLGSYRQDLPMRALQQRYTEDLCQSFFLTARYLSEEASLTYTIGPPGELSKLSEIVKAATGKSPLEREIKANIVDLIAQDLLLGLAFHHDNSSYSINWPLTSNFHAEVEDLIVRELDSLSGGIFYYRIEATYRPFKGMPMDRHFYSEIIYTNARGTPKGAEVYTTTFSVSVPVDEEALDNIDLTGRLPDLFFLNITDASFSDVLADIFASKNASPLNRQGEIKITVWPKGG
jgi:hypothetical protein